MLILYLKKSIGLQNRDEQSNNNAKRYRKRMQGGMAHTNERHVSWQRTLST